MGKLSIILVFSAILIGGTILYSMQRTSLHTTDRASTDQLEYLARNAAHAGLEHVMRGVFSYALPTGLSSEWADGETAGVPYEGGVYTVTREVGACSGITPANMDTISLPSSQHMMEVVSTGTYQRPPSERYPDITEVRHQVRACYVKQDVTEATPPALEYAFISNDDFEFNGGVEIYAYLGGDGNVHSNETMELGPNSVIHGHATFTEEDGSRFWTNGKISEDEKFSSWGEAPGVPMQPFDPDTLRSQANLISTGLPDEFRDGDRVTIPSDGPEYGPDNPFIWYVEGDLVVDGTTHLEIPSYATVVVEGDMLVGGSANITRSGTVPDDHPDMDDWIAANTNSDGKTTTGFYVNGYRFEDGVMSEEINGGVEINGGGAIVGNIYTNGDFVLNGGAQGSNLLGSVAALGTITGNGGGQGFNFWYTSMAQEIVIPGILIPKALISLIAISEWGDSVLRYASAE